MALALAKPLVGVNHLEGHIHSVLLENKMALREGRETEEATVPAVALVVSGGHTSLFLVEQDTRGADGAPAIYSYTRLGQTRDDAAGEAFDKVAKLLALGYPGGPIIDRLARFGNPRAVEFGRIRMKDQSLDFSFSGIKTAVLYRLRDSPLQAEADDRRSWLKNAASMTTAMATRVTADDIRAQCSVATLDLVASFQNAVISDLVDRTFAAADDQDVHCILVSGGVACNSLLRERFHEAAKSRGLKAFFPSLPLSTDNAAMIAAAGYFRLAAGHRADLSLTAHAAFPLGKKRS